MRVVNVQTAIPETLHEELAEIARRRKQSIKGVVKEALEEFCRREAPWEDDPFMRLIGSVKGVKGNDWSTRKDWRFRE